MKSNFDFETLIDQHSRLLWSISSGILGEYAAKEVIEDILSDVFAELYQFPEHFDEKRGSLKTWFCMRTRSLSLDYLKKSYIKDVSWSPDENAQVQNGFREADLISLDNMDPLEIVIQHEMTEKILDCIHQQESPLQDIMRLRFLYECKPVEIADALKLSVRLVYQFIRKGKKILIKTLKEEHHE